MSNLVRSTLPAIVFVSLAVGRMAAQDQLTAARDLYAAAAYEDALTVLNRMLIEPGSPEDRPRIEQYRAFCLLALGRSADAEQAIETLVTVAPWYRPSESDASPRVRSTFTDVRRRVLPMMVQRRYAAAKQAYDNKAFAEAVDGFREVLEVLDDPDVAPAAGRSPLSDIRTLAAGFHELAVAAATPPPPPAPPPSPEPAAAPREARVERKVYTGGDVDVVPPVAVRQNLPSVPRVGQAPLPPSGGVVEVVISEFGTVESAVMRVPISPIYDRMVVAAAREWRFEPAMRMGIPVKFRKMVQIAIKP
jgi:hypothetical protein